MGPTTSPAAAPGKRLATVDALRGIAALTIVLHHFSLYGPLAGLLQRDAPTFSLLAADYGRLAVYVFIVLAGFMVARTLAEHSSRPSVPVVPLLLRRYLRLVLPLTAALLLAVFCAAIARHWTNHEYIPAAVTPPQFLAHLVLMQSLLGFESLTTGVWYVAVEIQLFAVVMVMLYLRSRLLSRSLVNLSIAVLALASWAWWYPNPGLEDWAPHFFGAYALGILAAQAARPRLQMDRLFWGLSVIANLALLISDWSGRMAVALLTAVVLWQMGLGAWHIKHFKATVHWLGERSYALFLVHFPVLMLLNTTIATSPRLGLSPGPLLLAVGVILSIGLAALFYLSVERPVGVLLGRGRGVSRKVDQLPGIV